jgi:hypothetical protein
MIERDTPPPQGATKEAWTAWNISQALSGLDFMAIPYDDPDIVCALPEQAVRRAFPQGNFPGWDALVERWRRQRGVKLKPMAMSSVGMTSGTDTQFVQTVLANCGEHDTVRPALQRAVRELLASL